MYCLGGSSVLARGGSGDILTGIMATLRKENLFSLNLSVLPCSGMDAAEVLARQHGQNHSYRKF